MSKIFWHTGRFNHEAVKALGLDGFIKTYSDKKFRHFGDLGKLYYEITGEKPVKKTTVNKADNKGE